MRFLALSLVFLFSFCLAVSCEDYPPRNPPLPEGPMECLYVDQYGQHKCTCPTDGGTTADVGPTQGDSK